MMINALIVGARSSCGLRSKFMFSVKYSDFMKIGADPAKRCIRADGFRGGLGKIRHDQAVMVSARRLDRHTAQQWMIKIGGLEPGDIRRNLKEMFEDWQHTANHGCRHDSISDCERALEADHSPIITHR